MSDDDFISESSLEALQNIEATLQRIETSINDHSSSLSIIKALQMCAYAICAVFLFTSAWHSRWRYAARYQVNLSQVKVAKEPHDCDFMYAPIGEKFCEYNPKVSTLRWATSSTSPQAIYSTDEGKTWSTFTPDAGVIVPKYPTLEEVNVYWEKEEK